MNDENGEAGGLQRTIDWRQGLAIALGVPVLILPSIGYFANYVWAFAIIIWALSVFQGFMQNFAYGELAAMFPKASGFLDTLRVFLRAGTQALGTTGANCLEASAPGAIGCLESVLAIFSILIGSYLKVLFLHLQMYHTWLCILSGAIVFLFLILVNYRGLSGGATLRYILAVLSCPSCYFPNPFLTGHIEINMPAPGFHRLELGYTAYPDSAGTHGNGTVERLRLETATIYGPEYKRPKSDVQKPSLFAARLSCDLYSGSGSLYWNLGGGSLPTVLSMLPLAQITLGPIGGALAILILIAAMILIIQTAFLGASRLHSMAEEKPAKLLWQNEHARDSVNAILSYPPEYGFYLSGNPCCPLAASIWDMSAQMGSACLRM